MEKAGQGQANPPPLDKLSPRKRNLNKRSHIPHFGRSSYTFFRLTEPRIQRKIRRLQPAKALRTRRWVIFRDKNTSI
ncbi:hypothetical protein F444_17752 [Phytophthora nicotianae P1976]|uniref:Uncharacterized protein n=1 Tax=Phytophthora nicotianae P1976 TaxID=1317066 RepID=A0A080ZDX1_PHYNI|nr:hypothetical protein F444_17752 [Phytophthora nicotianae P1976]